MWSLKSTRIYPILYPSSGTILHYFNAVIYPIRYRYVVSKEYPYLSHSLPIFRYNTLLFQYGNLSHSIPVCGILKSTRIYPILYPSSGTILYYFNTVIHPIRYRYVVSKEYPYLSHSLPIFRYNTLLFQYGNLSHSIPVCGILKSTSIYPILYASSGPILNYFNMVIHPIRYRYVVS